MRLCVPSICMWVSLGMLFYMKDEVLYGPLGIRKCPSLLCLCRFIHRLRLAMPVGKYAVIVISCRFCRAFRVFKWLVGCLCGRKDSLLQPHYLCERSLVLTFSRTHVMSHPTLGNLFDIDTIGIRTGIARCVDLMTVLQRARTFRAVRVASLHTS
jgi:hypothetical protein